MVLPNNQNGSPKSVHNNKALEDSSNDLDFNLDLYLNDKEKNGDVVVAPQNPNEEERTRYREYDLAHLKLVFEFCIYTVWKSVRYGVSKGLDTAYPKDWIWRIGIS
ncbi:hypothetical protein Tco_1350533 [Tanacetum coccineum]